MIKTPMAVTQEYNKNAYIVCFQFCLSQKVGLIFYYHYYFINIYFDGKRVILNILKENTKTDFFDFLKLLVK